MSILALSRDSVRHSKVPKSRPSLQGGCLQPIKEQVSVPSDQQMREWVLDTACSTGFCCF